MLMATTKQRLIYNLQFWTKYFIWNKIEKSSKAGQDKESDIYFCLSFGWYCQSLLSGMQGGQ